MRVAFIGPVGVGKSTQAQRLAWSMPFYNRCPRLSTGDLIRAQIEAGTPLGKRVEALHDRGEPVPDGIVMDLLLPHLRTAGGFALDDFPASARQAVGLDLELAAGSPSPLHRVFSLEGPTDDELVDRVLGGRVHSRATDVTYHLHNDPPPAPERLRDAGPFERRRDDTEEALRRRLARYRGELQELKEYYGRRDILTVLDARKPLEAVAADVLEALGNPEGSRAYAV